MTNPYTDAMSKVLEFIAIHQKFFTKNPKPLAYLMSFYNQMHYSSRYDKNEELHDWDNPKDLIMELGKKLGNDYGNLFYDAWCFHSHSEEYKGKYLPLQFKINKTMDDWMKICLNPKYLYKSLYPSRQEVLSHYLCTIGSGTSWTKDGFISNFGPSGIDLVIFMGTESSFGSLPKPIQKMINDARKNPIIKKGLTAMKLAQKERDKDKQAMEIFCNKDKMIKSLKKDLTKCSDPKKKKDIQSCIKFFKDYNNSEKEETQNDNLFYPMAEDHSALDTMPDNAHPSYVKAGVEVCNLILANPKEKTNGHNYKISKRFLKKWGK